MTNNNSTYCPNCKKTCHSFDIFCPFCGFVLKNNPSIEELDKGQKITEIRFKIHDEKKYIINDYIKPYIPVIASLIIAVVGWLITIRYNEVQQEITERKNNADIEIARINSRLSYVNLLTNLNHSEPEVKDNAFLAIATALPPELSFKHAIKNLKRNQSVLYLLLSYYKEQSWKYIVSELETTSLSLDELYCIVTADEVNAFKEKNKIQLELMEFIDKENLTEELFEYLTSSNYARPRRRPIALVNYFMYIYLSNYWPYPVLPFNESILYKNIVSKINSDKLDKQTISDLTSSMAFVFVHVPESQTEISKLAAYHFWDSYNVSYGETPAKLSINYGVYQKVFQKQSIGKKIQSKALLDKLKLIDIEILNINRIDNLLYTYCMPRHDNTPYLKPQHSLEFIKYILSSLNSSEKCQKFSMILGSLSGSILYKELSVDKIIGKKYSELLINWYNEYYQDNWYIPKFLHMTMADYPELKSKIDPKWGVNVN